MCPQSDLEPGNVDIEALAAAPADVRVAGVGLAGEDVQAMQRYVQHADKHNEIPIHCLHISRFRLNLWQKHCRKLTYAMMICSSPGIVIEHVLGAVAVVHVPVQDENPAKRNISTLHNAHVHSKALKVHAAATPREHDNQVGTSTL